MGMIAHQPAREQETPLLRHVPIRRRSPVKNAFLDPVRAGIQDPSVIVREALTRLQHRLRGQLKSRTAAETLDLRQAITPSSPIPPKLRSSPEHALNMRICPPRGKSSAKLHGLSRACKLGEPAKPRPSNRLPIYGAWASPQRQLIGSKRTS
jgi:hypothetical protein